MISMMPILVHATPVATKTPAMAGRLASVVGYACGTVWRIAITVIRWISKQKKSAGNSADLI